MWSHIVKVVACALFVATSTLAAPPQFTDVSTTAIEDVFSSSRGVAWGDFDGDGFEDFYITNWSGTGNRLHRNNGDGTFTLVAGTPLSDTGFGGGATWADIDNDGDLDLFLVNSGNNKFFRNDGNNVFVDITTPELAHGGLSRSASWSDFDNDGLVDLYFSVSGITIAGQVNQLFRNLGGNVFVRHQSAVMDAPERVGRGMAWCDFDGDGHLDLYLANGGPPDSNANFPEVSHANALIRNNGDGTFSNVTPANMLLEEDDSRSVAWADYDNDGDFDLFVAKVSPGPNTMFANTPEGFVEVAPELGVNGGTRDAAWGDYDNDGDLDLYLSSQGTNQLFENVNGTFVEVTIPVLAISANGRGVAWGDYDNDGDLDLLIAVSGRNKLLRNDTVTDNNWLKVRLTGVISNRAAIGARVTVIVGDLKQTRVVTAGEGYMSHRPLVQHFGLGLAESVDRIEVYWPASQILQVIHNVDANQTIEFVEQIPNPADLNGDGLVNGADLATLLSQWGQLGSADLTGDGVVNGADLAALLAAWHTGN